MDLDARLQDRLRSAVIDLRRGTGRRRPPPVLYAGLPRGRSRSCPLAEVELDAALRTDLAGALIAAAGTACPLVWLSRAGLPDWHDLDAAWTGPIRTAWAERGE